MTTHSEPTVATSVPAFRPGDRVRFRDDPTLYIVEHYEWARTCPRLYVYGHRKLSAQSLAYWSAMASSFTLAERAYYAPPDVTIVPATPEQVAALREALEVLSRECAACGDPWEKHFLDDHDSRGNPACRAAASRAHLAHYMDTSFRLSDAAEHLRALLASVTSHNG